MPRFEVGDILRPTQFCISVYENRGFDLDDKMVVQRTSNIDRLIYVVFEDCIGCARVGRSFEGVVDCCGHWTGGRIPPELIKYDGNPCFEKVA
jgi:hypothetical protein